ncbi:MAG: glycoside hydrolase family 3 C-terminal domain-containing protein, partial [Ignavibacteriaceae bacterium]|nr:glycoside hydrolase family 3 C-terminal domain-containing protein [Ignavibacteriaceae bacterium]
EIIKHRFAEDKKDAALKGFTAGVDIDMVGDTLDGDVYAHYLKNLVEEGLITEEQINNSVRNVLRMKFKLGLFEDPYVNPEKIQNDVKLEKDRTLALMAAHETITLLKNDENILPISLSQFKDIAVIGPNAHRKLLGGYSGEPKYYTSVLDGIKQKVGNQVNVRYSEGCRLTEGGSWNDDLITFVDDEVNNRLIEEAVENVKKSEVIILALGGNEQTSREAWNKNHMGDRADLELFGRQNDLIKALLKINKPIIALLFNGRPNACKFLNDSVSTILECWYLGQETGVAVADVLFGNYNPSGKLPISFPRSAGHIPCYYNYKPSARRGYLNDEISPLYAFGYGLSYTSFKISNLTLEKSSIRKNESTKVFVDIQNTGDREGEEVIQLYIRDMFSSVTRPVKELRGFTKVNLKPSEKKTISMEVLPEHLAFTNINYEWTVESGDFEIMVGNSSRDQDLIKTLLSVI